MSLIEFYEHITARLAPPYVDLGISIAFGDHEPPKQINQGDGRANRVLLVPGDDSGSLGKYDGKTERGRQPRHLWNWVVKSRLFIWAVDTTAVGDRLKQWRAYVEMHDVVIEAVHSYAPGFYSIGDPREVGKQFANRFGYEAVISLEINQPVLATHRAKTGAATGSGKTVLVSPTGESEQGC